MIGLSGHSQGGGAVIKAGDGEPKDLFITATAPMNPYGPAWVNPQRQDGPRLLFAGSDDTTTPTDSFREVSDAVASSDGKGGVLAELQGGTHNDPARGVDGEGNTLLCDEAGELDFGDYQEVTRLWWDYHLNGSDTAMAELMDMLGQEPWMTEYGQDGYTW